MKKTETITKKQLSCTTVSQTKALLIKLNGFGFVSFTNLAMSFIKSIQNFSWKNENVPLNSIYCPIIAVAAYFISLFLITSFMKSRPNPISFPFLSKLHNLILSVWSFIMFIGLMYSVLYVFIFEFNFNIELLFTDDVSKNLILFQAIEFWVYQWYVSKYFELFDTIILAFKKKKLIFLHCYHHAIMVCVVWSWMEYNFSLVWWGMMCNTIIHTLMYYYYWATLVYPGIKIWWKIYLTQMQIIQFMSVFINLFVLYYLCVSEKDSYLPQDISYQAFKSWLYQETPQCSSPFWITASAQFVNISFLTLFINFFIQSYLKKPKKKSN